MAMPRQVYGLLRDSEQAKMSGDFSSAVAMAEKALLIDPTCEEALEEVADNYLSLQEHDKAKKAALFLLDVSEDSFTAHYMLGFIASKEGDFRLSVDYLEKANALQPNNPEILRCLGWSHAMLSNRTQAIVLLKRALQLLPDDAVILCDLGVCYMQGLEMKEAEQCFKKALESQPQDERALECLRFVEQMNQQVDSDI